MVKRFEVILDTDKAPVKFNITATDKHQAIASAIHWHWGVSAETVKYYPPFTAYGIEFNCIDYCVGGVMRNGRWDEVE